MKERSYVEHLTLEVEGFRVVDATSTDSRPHDDVVWVGLGGVEGRWLSPEQALAVASAITEVAVSHLARHGKSARMPHKVIVRETPEGYFVDRGTAQPMEFRKTDGEVGLLPRKYVYDGSTGIGYFTRAKAIEVAKDWFEPVEIVFEEQ